MSDHIPDVTKMISDTPRTEMMEQHAPVGIRRNSAFEQASDLCRQLERELNAANERIKNLESALSTVENIDKVNAYQDLESANERIKWLIAERDTARLQADQNWKLREEFTELLGTDDVEQGVAVVREMKERISKLNDYVAALETAGDLMVNELSYGYDVDMWNQAKEAKP